MKHRSIVALLHPGLAGRCDDEPSSKPAPLWNGTGLSGAAGLSNQGHQAAGWDRRSPTLPRLLVTAVTLLFGFGCFHPPIPYMPTGWPAVEKPLQTLSDRKAHPVLQVIIAYNVYWPNHTALRLVEEDGQTLFWDPGGGYGKETPTIVRHSDLILEKAPSLAAYMPYRWSNNDQVVEIFEWTLSAAEARRMAATLRTGTARTDYNQTGFRTATPGLFCNAAVSSFLYNHGRPSISVGDSYLLPNLLSQELYSRDPDRVMIIRRESRSSVLVLRPPEGTRKVAAIVPSDQP